jgi:hypothetical protein
MWSRDSECRLGRSISHIVCVFDCGFEKCSRRALVCVCRCLTDRRSFRHPGSKWNGQAATASGLGGNFLRAGAENTYGRVRDEEELAARRAHTSLPSHTNQAEIPPKLPSRVSITGLIDLLIPLPVRPHARASVQYPSK